MGAFASAFVSRIAGGFAEASDEAKQQRQASEREQRMGMSKVLQNMLGDENLKPEVAARIIPKLFELWTAKPGKSVKVDINEIYSPKRVPEQQILGATPQRRQFEQRREAGEPQLGPPPAPVPSPGVPPPPPGYQVSPQDIQAAFISPEEQQRRATQAQFETSRAQAMGRAAGTPPKLPTLPAEAKLIEFFISGGMSRQEAINRVKPLRTSETARATTVTREGKKRAIFYNKDGIVADVDLGPVDRTTSSTERGKNFSIVSSLLQKRGLPPEEVERLALEAAYGVNLGGASNDVKRRYASGILRIVEQRFRDAAFVREGVTFRRVLDEVLAERNAGLPTSEHVTASDVLRWSAAGLKGGLPTPPGESRGGTAEDYLEKFKPR